MFPNNVWTETNNTRFDGKKFIKMYSSHTPTKNDKARRELMKLWKEGVMSLKHVIRIIKRDNLHVRRS